MRKQINSLNPFFEDPAIMSVAGRAMLRALDVLLPASGIIDTDKSLDLMEVERLAEEAGYSKSIVTRGLEELLHGGFLTRTGNRVSGTILRTDQFAPAERLLRRYTLINVRPLTAGPIIKY